MIGYRVWVTRSWETKFKPRLASLFHGHVWTPGTNQAVCNRPRIPSFGLLGSCEHAPTLGCMCGLWVVSSYDEATKFRSARESTQIVIGAIRTWGRHIEHKKGTRCEYAQIIALLDAPQQAELYDVINFGSPGKLAQFADAERLKLGLTNVR